jgi:hypothetical protein
MKSYRTCLLAASITLLALSGAARAQSDDNDGCSNSTLKGDYAFTVSGQIFSPDGTSTLINAVAITNFDGKTDAHGKGGLTQVDFVVNTPPVPVGVEPTDPLTGFRTQESGTYQVFPDCTGQATINFPPHPGGLVIQLAMVLSSEGRKIHAVVSALTPPGAPGPIPGVAVHSDAEKIGKINHDRH